MKKLISMKIRPHLLQSIDLFCLKNEMTRTEYFEQLAMHHLKKRGYILTKKEIIKTWDQVEDMPAHPEYDEKTWLQIKKGA